MLDYQGFPFTVKCYISTRYKAPHKGSHLNIGRGLDWARHVRAMDEDRDSDMVEDSSLETNLGRLVPTGSSKGISAVQVEQC